MSQFEAQSRSIVHSKELWSQFQTEARANKISTTAGVKEMLKQKHEKSQQGQRNERYVASDGDFPIKGSGHMTLISALKRSRVSESDVSWRRRSSSGSTCSNGPKNEIFERVCSSRPRRKISGCLDDESGGSYLPFLPTRAHGIEDYGQAIRGNTHSVLSLYGTKSTKATSNRFARSIFRTLKDGLEQKQQGNEHHDADCAGGSFTVEASSGMLQKSSPKSTACGDFNVRRQTLSSCGFERSCGERNDFFDFERPPLPSYFHETNVCTWQNLYDKLPTIEPTDEVTCVSSSQNVSLPREREESTTVKSSNEEQNADFASSEDDDDDSDDDDKSNNGCFEYPPGSQQKALERSMRSGSLLVDWRVD